VPTTQRVISIVADADLHERVRLEAARQGKSVSERMLGRFAPLMSRADRAPELGA